MGAVVFAHAYHDHVVGGIARGYKKCEVKKLGAETMQEHVKEANAVLHRSRLYMHNHGLKDDRKALNAMKNLTIAVAEFLCKPAPKNGGQKPTLVTIASQFQAGSWIGWPMCRHRPMIWSVSGPFVDTVAEQLGEQCLQQIGV